MGFFSDEQLMDHLMNGTRSALAPLVERYHALLLGYLYRLTNGNRLLTEDLLQETFIHVLQQKTYQPGRLFKPWLYSIATQLAYDYFRSPENQRINPLHVQAEERMIDYSPGPEEQTQIRSENNLVAHKLTLLGEEYRVTLLLRFYQGLSLQEIAEVLNIPVGTVKSRLSVGTQRLRNLLVPIEEGEKE